MEKKTHNEFTNEYFIDCKELIWRLLEQWKALLLVAVFVMFVFLLGMHLHTSSDAKKDEAKQNETHPVSIREIIDSLPDDEQVLVESAYHLLTAREEIGTYINTSPIMHLDPSHCKRLRSSWAIDEHVDDVKTLTMSYVVELQSQEIRKRLAQASGIDMDESQFNDLLLIKYPDDTSHDVVCFDVFLTEDMQAENMQKELEKIVEMVNTKLQGELGNHQVLNYESEIAYVSDERIYSKQATIMNCYANYNNQITNLKNNIFTSEQKAAFEALQKRENASEDNHQERSTKAFTVRNIVLGLVLGGIAYIVLYFIYVVVANKVINSNVLQNSSVRVLGEWHSLSKDTKKDMLFKAPFVWRKHHRLHLDEEKELDKSITAIASICRYKAIHSLLLDLTEEQTESQQGFVRKLISRLALFDIDVKTTITEKQDNTIIDDLLIEADGIVIILLDSKTRVKDLYTLFMLCNDYNKEIIGSVYLG